MRKSDCFIDTNIWVYGLLSTDSDTDKQKAALDTLRNVPQGFSIVASTQVINEFHWILARKYKILQENTKLPTTLFLIKQ